MSKVRIDEITLAQVPSPKPDAVVPVMLTAETMAERKAKVLANMAEANLDVLVIYGDLEHLGNFEYLTGFITRFEECLLILKRNGDATLVLGNENLKMASRSRIPAKLIHCPFFSLPNQPMEGEKLFERYFIEAGIFPGMRVGLVGWKMFTAKLTDNATTFDVPYYITESLKTVVRDGKVLNAAHLFIGPGGARTTNNPNEIAHYEYGAALASDCVLRTMDRVEPGISELELGNTMAAHGQSRTVMTICSTGERYVDANYYPLDKAVKVGDTMSLTVGYRGGCTSRANYAVTCADELPENDRDWLDVVAKPYMASYFTWLEEVHVGMTGGELFDLVDEVLPRSTYGWTLCPGHLVADEEWLSSPVYAGSEEPIVSGMLFQIDIIPSMAGHAGVSCESGVAVADAELRAKIAEEYPELMARFEERRAYLRGVLGVNVNDDVLPLSSTVGYLRPFGLDKGSALARRA